MTPLRHAQRRQRFVARAQASKRRLEDEARGQHQERMRPDREKLQAEVGDLDRRLDVCVEHDDHRGFAELYERRARVLRRLAELG